MSTRDIHYNENFSACYSRYSSSVLNAINRYVGNRDIAEELMHEAYLKIFEKGIFIDPSCVTTPGFLIKVAKNLTIDYLKKSSRHEKIINQHYIEEAKLDDKFFSALDHAVISGEVISTLYDTINSLPEKERDVFEKKAFQKKKNYEICVESNVSIFILQKIIKGARQKIKDRLKIYFEN